MVGYIDLEKTQGSIPERIVLSDRIFILELDYVCVHRMTNFFICYKNFLQKRRSYPPEPL